MFSQLTFSFLWCSRKCRANQSPNDSVSSVALLQQGASLWALDLVVSIFLYFREQSSLFTGQYTLMTSLSLREITSWPPEETHWASPLFSIPLVTPPQEDSGLYTLTPGEKGCDLNGWNPLYWQNNWRDDGERLNVEFPSLISCFFHGRQKANEDEEPFPLRETPAISLYL